MWSNGMEVDAQGFARVAGFTPTKEGWLCRLCTARRDGTPVSSSAETPRPTSEQLLEQIAAALRTADENVRDDWRTAGELRVAHPNATMGQLGALHHPPITSAAVRSRLWRLLNHAAQQASKK
jgi:hypothetical protein